MKVLITGGGGFIGYRLAHTLLKRGTLADACTRLLQFDKYRNPKTGQLEPLRGLTLRRQSEHRTCRGEAL